MAPSPLDHALARPETSHLLQRATALAALPGQLAVAGVNITLAAGELMAPQGAMRRRGGYLDQLSANLQPLKASWYASGSSAGTAAEQSETRLRAAAAEISQIIAQFSSKTTEAHDLQLALENKNAGFFA